MAYPIITVPDDASTQLEQLGTKAKFWYRDDNNNSMLFKQGRPGTGENWSEKVCCEICKKLNLPHAEYNFAAYRGVIGVITPNFVPENCRLILGNELLSKFVEGYDTTQTYSTSQHTLRRVIALLKLLSSAPNRFALHEPIDWVMPHQVGNVIGIFVGYLLLDALVGNQDRHHENWGIITSPESGLTLTPTFDHASSLGRNETDENRLARLNSKDHLRSVEHYVSRARSGFYPSTSSRKAYTTMEAFAEIAKMNSNACRYWLEQLRLMQRIDFDHILAEVPNSEISDVAREFALRMLDTNKSRILDVGDKL
ncbi:MAG: phosphatidylinositol kinase [Gammaproteobacteria bacterium]|nr:phosphatidylinositol kinase [Gammaproteobacteria bacterium]